MSGAEKPLNLDALAAQARGALELDGKATPGPWTYRFNAGDEEIVTPTESHIIGVECAGDARLVIDKPDGNFIARTRTLTPDLARAVLALVERVRELEGAVAVEREACAKVADECARRERECAAQLRADGGYSQDKIDEYEVSAFDAEQIAKAIRARGPTLASSPRPVVNPAEDGDEVAWSTLPIARKDPT